MFPLFPVSSLDNSILTSVFVGLLVVWYFQETLGWNFTGLVVPGYLASVLVIQPVTGAVMAAEAVVTWAVVLLLSERVPSWWPWTPLFGRDRFFLFLLTSVGVRMLVEGGGLEHTTARLGLEVDAGLHSMGLVVVPLTANALWRSGAAGVLRIAVPVLVTWALLEFVLLRHTNLSLSRFELTYEDLALDFVSSPRAYILLLVGAALGSAVNLRWGWDFGGLIVPGLLALCWVEPVRVVTTLAEATVIAGALLALLRLPALRGANLTGGRPLVLAFATGYAIKFVLGWLARDLWPGLAVRDLFGFGYLLSSIIALRMVRHGEVFRALVPAVLTSFAAFVVGTGIGSVLAIGLPARPPPAPVPTAEGGSVIVAAWGEAPVLLPGPGGALTVACRAGPLGLVEATFAVAEALGAGVVVCGGAECPAGPEALWVEADEASTLTLDPALAPRVDLAALGGRVGAFTVGPSAGGARLSLSTEARLRAAATRGHEPGPIPEAGPEAGAAPEEPPPGPAELRALQEGVVRPVAAWQAGAPWGEDALRVAAGNAEALGVTLTRTGELARLAGPGWALEVVRGGRPMVLHLPRREEPGAAPFARALARTLAPAFWVESAGGPPGGDATAAERRAHVALLSALEALGPAVQVITARGMPQRTDPGADVVLSVGRPLAPGEAPTPVVRRLRTLLSSAGLLAGQFDGSPRRIAFADAANRARAPVRAATGEDRQVTAFADERAAAALDAAGSD